MVKEVMTSNKAVAEAVRLAKPQVIPVYPITPQTTISEYLAQYVADEKIDAKYVKVESEHSAISAAVGASGAGVRVFTATSSQGLMLMHEILFAAAGMRTPFVLADANRAISAPLNIWNDQQDSIAQRDAGWLQIYVENAQEALDTTLMAYKISENPDVLLPSMVCLDGFILTHTVEPVEIPLAIFITHIGVPQQAGVVKFQTLHLNFGSSILKIVGGSSVGFILQEPVNSIFITRRQDVHRQRLKACRFFCHKNTGALCATNFIVEPLFRFIYVAS